jgi:hypothetical protein
MINQDDIFTYCDLEDKILKRVIEVTRFYNEIRGWDTVLIDPEFYIEDGKFWCNYYDKWNDNNTLVLDLKYLFMPNVKEVFRIEFEQYQARKKEQEENRKRREKKSAEETERQRLRELLEKYPEELQKKK